MKKKIELSIIASITENLGLGRNNDLILKIPEDLKYFKKTTFGHPIIMGRKTLESIGRILPGRKNIVITSGNITIPGVIICHSLEDAITEAAKENKEIFVIGGSSVYEQSIHLADKLYLTEITIEKAADTYFPQFKNDFSFYKNSGGGVYNKIEFQFNIYTRRSNES